MRDTTICQKGRIRGNIASIAGGALFLAITLAPCHAPAFTTNAWTNSVGGTWETATSWSQGSVPAFDDFVRITATGTYTVTVGNTAADTVPNSFTNVALDIVSTLGRPTLDFTYTNAINFVLSTNGSSVFPLRIGNATLNWNAPNAAMTFSNGSIVSINTAAGFGTDGILNVYAGRINALRLHMGANAGANSTLNIYTGGVFAFTSSDSRVGSGAGAQINILGGTMVWSNQMFVGINSTSTGRVVLVDGLLHVGNSGTMELGSGSTQGAQQGFGQLIISNGVLQSTGGNIEVGAGPRSRGEMLIYGGSITNAGGNFHVGDGAGVAPPGSATGMVMMAGGNWVSQSSWRLGRTSNSIGTVTITGGDVLMNFGNLSVNLGDQDDATGQFNMQGGTFTVASNLTRMAIGVGSNSVGTLNVSGGLMDFSKTSTGIIVGSNAFATARMNLDGGLVRLTTINVTSSGILSNRTGGVLQFVGTDNVQGPGTANRIVDGGTLSYRNYSALTVSVAAAKFNIVSGSGLQLDSSTNANIAGTFTLANAASSFKELSLTGANPKWNSDALEITSGSRLHVTNATGARVASVVTNNGTILVQNSTVTYEKPVIVSGDYISDPSTNTFLTNVTVTASGALVGGAGDMFDFKKSLSIHSTNRVGFDLLSSRVSFSGGGDHTNLVTGVDVGTNGLGHSHNFIYGELTLGSASDHLYVGTGDNAFSNALYVFFLDMPGGSDAAKLSVATNNLHTLTPNINVYYAVSNLVAANSYLQDLIYPLSGGGFLIPATVPEPSALAFLIAAGALLLRKSRNT